MPRDVWDLDDLGDPDDSDDHDPLRHWGPSGSPNTADGEIRGVSAFAAAATNATGWRRTLARVGALVALALIALYVLTGFLIATR